MPRSASNGRIVNDTSASNVIASNTFRLGFDDKILQFKPPTKSGDVYDFILPECKGSDEDILYINSSNSLDWGKRLKYIHPTEGQITCYNDLSHSCSTIGLATTDVTPGNYSSANITVDEFGRIISAEDGGDGEGTITSISQADGVVCSPNPITNTGTIGLATTSVTPGNYSSANITVDEFGRIISAEDGGDGEGTITSISQADGVVCSPNPITNTGTIGLATTSVTPGNYSSANITVDEFGRIISAEDGGDGEGTITSISQADGVVCSPNPITNTGTIGLATTDVTPGSYSSANIVVDEYGRITNASGGADHYTFTDGRNPFVQTQRSNYTTMFMIIFRGTDVVERPSVIKMIHAQTVATHTHEIRIRDITNGTIIAELTGLSNTNPQIDIIPILGEISSGEAIWEIETRKIRAGGSKLYSMMIVY